MMHVLQATSKISPPLSSGAFLQKAIEEGDLHAIHTLLKQGSPVNIPLPSKEIPLHAAVRSPRFSNDKDKIEAVKLLIQWGADLDAKDIYHLTALDHAIHLQNMPLAEAILSKKIGIASEKIKSQVGIHHSFADVIERLNQRIAIDPTALGSLQKAAYEGNLEELRQATASTQRSASTRLRIDQPDRHGLAPIHYAILGNQAAAFQSLLKLGADPKVLTRNKESIIHLAAIKKSPLLLQLALACKVDVNHQNSQGETALHYAFLQEHWIGIRTLVQQGADLSIADLYGISPPAAFMSMSLQKDPLSLSTKDAAQAVFGMLFLWQLGSQNFTSLSDFRSWSPAFAASFFGFLGVQAIPSKEHEKMAAISSVAKEFLPVLGLGWTAKKTYHSLSSSFQMVKRGWEFLGYRNRDALQNIAVGSVSAIARLALCGAQSTVQLGMILPYTENPPPEPLPPRLPMCDPSQNPALWNPTSLKNLTTSQVAASLAVQGNTSEDIAEMLKMIYPVSRPAPSPISTATPSPTLMPILTTTLTPTPIPQNSTSILSQLFPLCDTNRTAEILAAQGNKSKEIAEILKPICPVLTPTPLPISPNPTPVLTTTPIHQAKIADRSQRPRHLFGRNDMPISYDEIPQGDPNDLEIISIHASNHTNLTSNILSSFFRSAYSCYQVGTKLMKLSAYFALTVGAVTFLGKRWLPNRYRLWLDMTGDRNLPANQNGRPIKMHPLSIITDIKKMGTQSIKACWNYIRFQIQTNPGLQNTQVKKRVRKIVTNVAPARLIAQMVPPTNNPSTTTDWGSQSEIFSSSSSALPVLTPTSEPLSTPPPPTSYMQMFLPTALAIKESTTSSSQLSPPPLVLDGHSSQAQATAQSSQSSTGSFSENSFRKSEVSAVGLSHFLNSTPPTALAGPSSQEQLPLKKERLKKSDDSPRLAMPPPNPSEQIASPFDLPRPAPTTAFARPRSEESYPVENEGLEEFADPPEEEILSSNPSEEESSNGGWYEWLWAGNNNNPQEHPRELPEQQVPPSNPGQGESSSEGGWSRWWYGS